jgi:hypothetical protein
MHAKMAGKEMTAEKIEETSGFLELERKEI